jgi:D-alanine-D-alanine ligase
MKRIAVLRGGPSEEYDVSMLTGKAVLEALAATDHHTRDIMIAKNGQWFEQGRKRTPDQALEGVDVVFIALHGTFGEDGQVQRIIERKHIPFTGSPSLASSIAFNKELTKHTLRPHGINLAKHRRVNRDERNTLKDDVAQIIADLGTQLFIKPLSNGSSFGARRVMETVELHDNLVELLELYDSLLVEEYIGGTEATVGVLSDFRGERLYALPTLEITPPIGDGFYTSANKYNGTTDHICPGRFSEQVKNEMSRIAKLAHTEVGCDQYSRTDFLVRGDDIYFLEINTLPGFTNESNYPIAANAIGLDFRNLVIHLIETARA